MSELGGNGFTSGAIGAGANQALQKQLANIKDPNLRLIISSLVGATASKLVGGNAKVGGSTAYAGTLYNDYVHRPTTPGAIVYCENNENGEGRGYYEVQSNGAEKYLDDGVKPGDVFWVDDGKYIDGKQMGNEWIVGDNGAPIAFSWTSVQIPIGGTVLYDYLTVDIAVNQETGKEVVINGRTVMSPDSSARYNDAVAKYEESMKVPELIAGFVNPGSKGVSIAEKAAIYAKQATKNMDSPTVVLGKFNQDGISYVDVAQKYEGGATYFQLDDWDKIVNIIGEENIWYVNKAFIKQQAEANKTFILSHNPYEATGYFSKEVDLLLEMGYDFVQEGSVWRAYK